MPRPLIACALASVLLLSGPGPAWAESPRASVVLLMDLSYSLRLREGGVRRIDLLRAAVSDLLETRGIEWALLSFRDLGDFRLTVPLTEDAAAVRAGLPALPGGRLSPIREAVAWAGEYLVSHARSQKKAVVLVSDGIGTAGSSFATALGKGFAEEGVALFVLGVDHKDNPPIREALESVARGTGGDYIPYHRVGDLSRALTRLPGRRTASVPAGTRLAQIAPDVSPSPRSTPLSLPPLDPWLVAAGLLGLAAPFLLRRKWHREDASQRPRRRVRSALSLGIVHPDGRRERLNFERSPVRVGGGAEARLRVAGADRTGFSIAWDRRGAWLEASPPVVVNGVGRARKDLAANDRITLAATRIVFLGLTVREENVAPAPRPRPDLTPLVAASAVLVLLGAIFALARGMDTAGRAPIAAATGEAGGPPPGTVRPGRLDAGAPQEELLRHEVPRAPAASPPRAPEPAAAAPVPPPAPRAPEPPPRRAPAPAAAAPTPPLAAAARAAFAPPAEVRAAPRAPLTRVAPGQAVPFFKADLLCFHAHPDDESLDFAGLMSVASRRGLKVAVVLFTDGETGVDQYPDRPSGAVHLPKVMTGPDLARARVDEATKALEILGASTYVRLGLANHPYNTLADEMRRDRILASWGGEDRLVATVTDLIRGFRPEVVVSSDFNDDAYEHFEHKAVGHVVRTALERMFPSRSARGAYLVSVDPFQGPLYKDLVRLDLMKTDPLSGLSYREVQMAALKEHVTQADASLLGVEFLPNFRYEQYHTVYWNLPGTPQEILASR